MITRDKDTYISTYTPDQDLHPLATREWVAVQDTVLYFWSTPSVENRGGMVFVQMPGNRVPNGAFQFIGWEDLALLEELSSEPGTEYQWARDILANLTDAEGCCRLPIRVFMGWEAEAIGYAKEYNAAQVAQADRAGARF